MCIRDRFKQYAEQLVAEGKAYYCFCTEERLEALHAEQRAAGEMTHYDGCCRELPKEEVEKRLDVYKRQGTGRTRLKVLRCEKQDYIDLAVCIACFAVILASRLVFPNY